jgi:uncharacterized protein YbjT (DUF2867 family)
VTLDARQPAPGEGAVSGAPEAVAAFEDAFDAIATATGRPVRFVPIELEQFAAGVPQEFADFLSYLFGEVLKGRNAHLTDGVREALGRPARSFREYVRDSAATGAWTS